MNIKYIISFSALVALTGTLCWGVVDFEEIVPMEEYASEEVVPMEEYVLEEVIPMEETEEPIPMEE